MGISGNIKTMALAELLQWLSQGQKTGTLVIDGKRIKKRVFFEEGLIVSSASTDPKEYLGHFLTSHGFITEEEANSAVARQKQEKQLLGQILVGMGAITEEQLVQVLQLKAEESIYDIFTWEEGEFVFLDDELPAENFVRMNLDVQWIVLEGSRRMDEWMRIREWVPSPLAVPVLICDYESLDIDEVDKRILAWVDDDRTVAEISQGAQTSTFMISQTLAQYVQQGVIKVVRPRIIEVEVPASGKGAAAGKEEASPQPTMPQMPQMMPQMPQGYPQMMPGQMPYSGMPQAYMPPPGYDPPSGYHPVYNAQPNVDVAGRTLHFAGGSGPPPPVKPQSEAEQLLQKAEQHLRQGDLPEALDTYREAKKAQGGGPKVDKAVQSGELKIIDALERDGIVLTAVPKLKCDMSSLTQLDISPQEGFMLTRIDGSYDIQSILKMSPMPKIDAQMLFWKLKKLGHVAL